MAAIATRRASGDVAFFRRSSPFFAAMLLLAIPAFWPSYFFPKQYDTDWHVHVHGVALFLWSVMLISQPWLIGRGRIALHRMIGKASYVIAPTIVVSTLLLARFRMQAGPTPDQLYFLCVQFALITAFAIAYVQAIRWRRTGGMHARYMICTGLAMIDPIVARLLYNNIGLDIPWLQVATYLFVDAILLALWLRDWRAGNGVRVFPAMLALFVVLELPTFFVPETGAWLAFGRWFGALPLP